MYFNPRTPYGVRQTVRHTASYPDQFQSTHSIRSATSFRKLSLPRLFQSTHSIRSATRTPNHNEPVNIFQSTHSIRSATSSNVFYIRFNIFQSTHSIRSATNLILWDRGSMNISIHALHTECDHNKQQC